jgi:hypothetical protein
MKEKDIMPERKMLRKSGLHHSFRAWLFSGLLALALVFLIGNQVYAQVQQTNDSTAIKQVVLTAAGASLRAVVVPHTQASYATAISPMKALAATTTDLAVAQVQAHTLFNSVYDLRCIPCQLEASKTYQTLQSEGKGQFRALAWSVRDVDWREVLLNGQTASVTLAVTLWSEVQYVDEFGKLNTVTPTGGEVIIYALAKIGTSWLITNQVPDDVATSSLLVNQVKPNGQTGGPPAGEPSPVKKDQKVKKLKP